MKKQTTSPSSVDDEDWVVLKPKATLTKKLFKNKSSPSKGNVGEVSLG
jgi:hypothetical protein